MESSHLWIFSDLSIFWNIRENDNLCVFRLCTLRMMSRLCISLVVLTVKNCHKCACISSPPQAKEYLNVSPSVLLFHNVHRANPFLFLGPISRFFFSLLSVSDCELVVFEDIIKFVSRNWNKRLQFGKRFIYRRSCVNTSYSFHLHNVWIVMKNFEHILQHRFILEIWISELEILTGEHVECKSRGPCISSFHIMRELALKLLHPQLIVYIII